jgi:hypothetical protein
MAVIALEKRSEDVDTNVELAIMSLEEAIESVTRVGRDLTRLIELVGRQRSSSGTRQGAIQRYNETISEIHNCVGGVRRVHDQHSEWLMRTELARAHRPTMLEVSAAHYATKEQQDEAELRKDLDTLEGSNAKRKRTGSQEKDD